MEKVAHTFSVSKEKHDLIVKRNVDSHNISSLITECIQQLPYETQQDAAAWTPWRLGDVVKDQLTSGLLIASGLLNLTQVLNHQNQLFLFLIFGIDS